MLGIIAFLAVVGAATIIGMVAVYFNAAASNKAPQTSVYEDLKKYAASQHRWTSMKAETIVKIQSLIELSAEVLQEEITRLTHVKAEVLIEVKPKHHNKITGAALDA